MGRVGRAHGVRGEVVVALRTDRRERLGVGSELWAGERRLVVEAARPLRDRWLVRFGGVEDRAAAEALTGAVLAAEPIDDPEALWVHDLIGTRVVEQDGTERGCVVAVVDNPASDLLELDSGALVPAVFVVGCTGGVTTVAAPAGLFDER